MTYTDSCTALFATAMFHNLGVEWAGSLLGFLAIAFLPIPFLFYIFGERLRKLSKYAPTDLGKKKDDGDEEKGNAGGEGGDSSQNDDRTLRNGSTGSKSE